MDGSHWTPALQTLQESQTGIYGPESFRDYLRNNGNDPRDYRTAAEISIDTRTDLARKLERHDTMVFRLGRSPEGRGTQFALIQVADHLDDFFIDEDDFSSDKRTEFDYSPNGTDTDLLGRRAQDILEAYRLLPTFSESSLVNLALSTGLLSRALDLDVERIGTAPTTIASTFDFKFEPHPTQPTLLHHKDGQVEIDALAMTRRNGKRVLLVIEAKKGLTRSLAKHKLCYPLLGTNTVASGSVANIIPIYLRARSRDQHLLFDIYECAIPKLRKDQPCLSEIEVIKDTHYLLKINKLE